MYVCGVVTVAKLEDLLEYRIPQIAVTSKHGNRRGRSRWGQEVNGGAFLFMYFNKIAQLASRAEGEIIFALPTLPYSYQLIPQFANSEPQVAVDVLRMGKWG